MTNDDYFDKEFDEAVRQAGLSDFLNSVTTPEGYEKIKEQVKARMKEAEKGEVGETDYDFFVRMSIIFDDKYKTPLKSYQAMQRLAMFSIFMMLKSARQHASQESESLSLISCLMPLVAMLEELGKGMKIIGAITDKIILNFTTQHPEILAEASKRFDLMMKDNAEARKRFEKEGFI